MSFLAPILLFGLPLALIPIIVHLIHLLRRKRVKWAAMMFLLLAQRTNKGLSKLRQYLILAFRVMAVAAIIFVVGRPLAGGLLGLTGGAPDSVIILLDRSASMEQQLLTTGTSKRTAGLRNLTAAIKDAYGKRSKLVLIDSASLQPVSLETADALLDIPQVGPTDTAADIPSLMQGALDYMTTNQTGRTDVWLVSDLRQTDWNPAGGRWAALRGACATLQGVKFQVLTYAETQPSDLGISVEKIVRRGTSDKAELLLDIRLKRGEPVTEPIQVPIVININGVTSTMKAELKGNQAFLQAQSIPIDKTTLRGWGSVQLPADTSPSDNLYHFVFDAPAPLKSVIVSTDGEVSTPLAAALNAPADSSRTYASSILPATRDAEIAWEETSLIIWQETIPDPESPVAKQLIAHVKAGRSLIFLPPTTPDDTAFAGLHWTKWGTAASDKPSLASWWRSDAGLLSGTRAGSALPVGEVEVQRWCGLEGESVPFARLDETAEKAPLLVQASADDFRSTYFLTALPGSGQSSLARDGVVMFALLHRALNEGSASLGNAQQRTAGPRALGEDPGAWTRLDIENPETILPLDRPLRAGVLKRSAGGKSDLLIAINRPLTEDTTLTLGKTTLDEVFAGLDWRLLERTLENEKSLTSEIWRTFLILMAILLILEALLCMPAPKTAAEFQSKPA